MDCELRQLSIGYKTRKGVHTVATDISATIHGGALTCLLGENGVGKSTLLRTLSAFQAPLDGTIALDGRTLDTYDDAELSKTVGVVLTEKPDVGRTTVYEVVALGRSPYTGFWGTLGADDRQAVDEAIAMVGIGHLSQREVGQLSDGERQKVMIAKALAQQTPLIFLDEPTAFLDYPSKVDMLLLLRRISREAGKTVFLSTHDLELALQIADTVWLMGSGGTILVGTPRELAAQGAIGRFVERSPGVTFHPETLSVELSAPR